MIPDVSTPTLIQDNANIRVYTVSEITVTHCLAPPHIFGDLCAPHSTVEQDAIKGKWVRVPRNLNLEMGYASGYLVCVLRQVYLYFLMP